MREIKFRGKRKDNGEWVYGYFVKVGVSYILPFNKTLAGDFMEVIPETVGQFTGLLDKNGKEIYEGDIVRSVSGKKWVCEWEGIGFDPFVANMEHSGDGWHYEVIGNIHENPELLQEKNND